MSRFFLLIACLLSLISVPALAGREHVARVKDGDTFELTRHRIFGTSTSIRVLGIDTPEHDFQAKCPEEKSAGMRAMMKTQDLIDQSQGLVWLSHLKRDKFGGRFDADVRLRIEKKWVSLADALTKSGLARPFTGQGPKPDWCTILAPLPVSRPPPPAPLSLLPAGFDTSEVAP